MKRIFLIALVCCLCPAFSMADYVIYRIPGVTSNLILQGKTTTNRDYVSYTHPTLGLTLNFKPSNVKVLKAPTTRELQSKMMSRAGTDPQKIYEAAFYALKKGLLTEFYRGVESTLAKNPNHTEAKMVKALKERFDVSIPESQAEEDHIRKLMPKSDMKIIRTKHFIVLHDTDEKPRKGEKKSRTQSRVELLEQVYETFLMFFYAQGIELDIPTERMMVVLFSQHSDFENYSKFLMPSVRGVAGFYVPRENISVFYDHSSTEEQKALKEFAEELRTSHEDTVKEFKKNKIKPGPEVAQIKKLADTIDILRQIQQENDDIEVVSHEATHQMAGNTGLFPRVVRAPRWAHEGLATYFESPGDTGWSGVGAVNDLRLDLYNTLEPDREHSNIDFIITNQFFTHYQPHVVQYYGYGQGWALTHFLMEKHPKKFVEYYRRIGEMPPDAFLSDDILRGIFNDIFGADRTTLDIEWRTHMRSLKTDFDTAVEADRK